MANADRAALDRAHGPWNWLLSAIVACMVSAACVSGTVVVPSPDSTPVPQPSTRLAQGCANPRSSFYEVKQPGMEDTLVPGDDLLVDASTHSFQRGDIVVFSPPPAGSTSAAYVKRVIGLPGDVIDLRDGHVFINDREVVEPYVPPSQATDPETGQTHFVVPADSVFVLGDEREASSDSRTYGPISLDTVVGRAVYRCLPADRAGALVRPEYPGL